MVPDQVIEQQYQQYRKSRSPQDLTPVLQALAPKLTAAAMRAGLDEAGAEDAKQETFLGFIKAEEQLDSEQPIVPDVRDLAIRQINAEIRRRKRLQQVTRPGDSEPIAADLSEMQPLERARPCPAAAAAGDAILLDRATARRLATAEAPTGGLG